LDISGPDGFTSAVVDDLPVDMVFLTHKEQGDWDLAVKLRREGTITTPGAPFVASMKAELDALRASETYRIGKYDPEGKHRGVRLFNSRFVNEIKGKTTVPFEKSRLVIQAFNDKGKAIILTQSPTIQRASQRLVITLVPLLFVLPREINLFIRDIT
jgi:hypothetical protein